MLMKKIVKVLLYVLFVYILIFWIAIPFYKEIKENREVKLDSRQLRNYSNVLCISNVYDEDGKINKVKKMTEHRDLAMISVYYYNIYHEDKVSYDMLYKEFKRFCSGKDTNDILDEYTTFILKSKYAKPEKIDGEYKFSKNSFFDICFAYMGDNSEELSDEEIIEICDKVYAEKEDVFLYDMYYYYSQSTFILDLFFTPIVRGYSDEEIGRTPKLESSEDGEVAYLTKGKWIWSGEKEEWIITKVEQNIESIYNIGYIGVGDKYGDREIYRLCDDFEIVEDTPERVVFSMEDVCYITYDFENGICTKATVEFKIDELYD